MAFEHEAMALKKGGPARAAKTEKVEAPKVDASKAEKVVKSAAGKKEIHEMHFRKAKGGTAVKHIHENPKMHPDAHHFLEHGPSPAEAMSAMSSHMQEHMGQPNEGEEMETPAGQAGPAGE